jgi:RNA polymerase sigma-70 factor (ECF subfamily)
MPLDAAHLANLIETQAASLRLWVRWRCASPEDVVQEAFCRLAVQEPPPDNPVAWLYQVCRNLAEKDRRTDLRRRQRESAAARWEGASDETDPLEIAETLAAVEELDPELREVLVARLWGQLTLDEVGKLCGISTATAFRRYEAALTALRAKLDSKCEEQR